MTAKDKKDGPTNPNKFKTHVDDNGRECTSCEKYKEWDKFPKSYKEGLYYNRASMCKNCLNAGRRSKGRKKERWTYRKYRDRMKEEQPHLWRARNIRSHLMSRAKKLGMDRSDIPIAEEIEEWLLEQEPITCYYSGNPVDLFEMNIDHKVPLSRGGTNTFDNLCITEHKMNSAKGQMTDDEFNQLLDLMKSWEDGGQYVLMRLRQGFMGKR